MEYKCLRCYHIWKPRKTKKPVICPKCKSPYWDTPPKHSKGFIESIKNLIISMNDKIIKHSGGTAGIRDEAGVYNAAYRITNYLGKTKNPAKVGAYIFDDLARRHHFVDGNKRTAYGVTKVILLTLNHHLKVDYKTAVPFIINIAQADSPVSRKDVEIWLKNNVIKFPSKNIDIYLKDVYYYMHHRSENGKGT